MISQSDIDTALNAAKQPIMVESDQQLHTALKQWRSTELLGIDTEFVRERTWRADLGLIQVSDGKQVWLVDPLKTASLADFATLLEDEGTVKILHAPSEDLDVLLYNAGAVPTPVFDTQTACAMLGEPLQLGYHSTVEWLLGLTIDKGETRSNWIKRPLRPAQLHYAALDVCLLPIMFNKLTSKLVALNRLGWLQEDCERLLTRALTPANPEDAWKRINGHGRLDSTSLAILQSLALWRDQVAEKRNLARGFVIKDNALMTISVKQPGNVEALNELDIWHPKAVQRHGRTVINEVNRIKETGVKAVLPDVLEPRHKPVMNSMRRVVQRKAVELKVEPALLASKRDLEALILTPVDESPPERFLGWRYGEITPDLMEIMAKT